MIKGTPIKGGIYDGERHLLLVGWRKLPDGGCCGPLLIQAAHHPLLAVKTGKIQWLD